MKKNKNVFVTKNTISDVTKMMLTRGGFVDIVIDRIELKEILDLYKQVELNKKKHDQKALEAIEYLKSKMKLGNNFRLSGRGLIAKGEVHFDFKYVVQLKDSERVSNDF